VLTILAFPRVEDALEAAGIRYDRLDGTMKRDDRTRAMDALKHDPGCEVLLVSLKAGGVGLNLTAAQRVYLMDPYWWVPLDHHTQPAMFIGLTGILPSRIKQLIVLFVVSSNLLNFHNSYEILAPVGTNSAGYYHQVDH
jgi:hypothetical protein